MPISEQDVLNTALPLAQASTPFIQSFAKKPKEPQVAKPTDSHPHSDLGKVFMVAIGAGVAGGLVGWWVRKK